jgi:hypothetical protein
VRFRCAASVVKVNFVFKLTIVLLNLSSIKNIEKTHRFGSILIVNEPAMVVEYPNFISSVAAKGKACLELLNIYLQQCCKI